MNVSVTCTDASPLISFPGHAMKCASGSGVHGGGGMTLVDIFDVQVKAIICTSMV